MSAPKTAKTAPRSRPPLSLSPRRRVLEKTKKQLELIQKRNEKIIEATKEKIRKNNEQIRQLLIRAFTSKREGRDVSPVVRQRLEALENVLLKHEDKNEKVLEKIAEALDDAVLLTQYDIKDAIESARPNTFIERLTKSITRRLTKRGSPSSMRGGKKTRKNRGKKQKTQKRKQSMKKRNQTQIRKQRKKK